MATWLTNRLLLDHLAFRVRNQRLRKARETMPLELKGLKANMMRLHRRIDTLNQLASAGDTKGGELEKALTEVGSQLAGHLDDLTFAATMLGNGSGDSGEGAEKPKVPAAVQEPTPPQTAVASPDSQQTASQPAGSPAPSEPGQ